MAKKTTATTPVSSITTTLGGEEELYAALSKVGSVLYHYKGFYSICIVDFVRDSEGVEWVSFFNRENAGDDYKEFDGSFVRNMKGDKTVSSSDIVRESFYKQNQVHACSVSRMMEKSSVGGFKWVTSKIPLKPYVPIELVSPVQNAITATYAKPLEPSIADPVSSVKSAFGKK